MATLGQLITRTLTRLRSQGGLDIQVYTQPVLAEMIQHKFDVLFDRRFWNRFIKRGSWTLDGATGVVTADLSSEIKRFEDIRYVWPQSYRNHIPILSPQIPTQFVSLTCFGPNPNPQKVFTVYPITTAGPVHLMYRTKPPTFTETDEVPFDDQILILGACLDYLADEGASDMMVEKYNSMYMDRLDRLEKLEDNNSRSLYSQSLETAFMWRDA
jgi:hypothetical protein